MCRKPLPLIWVCVWSNGGTEFGQAPVHVLSNISLPQIEKLPLFASMYQLLYHKNQVVSMFTQFISLST